LTLTSNSIQSSLLLTYSLGIAATKHCIYKSQKQPERRKEGTVPDTMASHLCAVVHGGAEIVGNIHNDHLPPRPSLEIVEFSVGNV